MLIETTDNNSITVTLSSPIDKFGLHRIIDYLKYLEATAHSTAKQSAIDKLADEVNEEWWQANKSRFSGENNS